MERARERERERSGQNARAYKVWFHIVQNAPLSQSVSCRTSNLKTPGPPRRHKGTRPNRPPNTPNNALSYSPPPLFPSATPTYAKQDSFPEQFPTATTTTVLPLPKARREISIPPCRPIARTKDILYPRLDETIFCVEAKNKKKRPHLLGGFLPNHPLALEISFRGPRERP